jgi:hypothetical protein
MIRYQYVTTPRRRNPVTVAYTARETEFGIEITLGASFCSSRDRFNRPLGRRIAEGRLTRGEAIVFTGRRDNDAETYGQAIVRLIEDFITSRSTDVMARFCQRQMD